MVARLKKGDASIRDVLKLSRLYYNSEKINIDDKARRARIDVVSGKIIGRRGLEFNRSTKVWEQVSRETRIDLFVYSEPTSYEKIDTINRHRYPVTFLLRDFDKGFDSAFKWRTGSLKKPVFAKKGMNQKQRIEIANKNIRNGVQLQFFFHLEYVLKLNNLLFGVNYAAWPPNKTNKRKAVYFDKTAYWVVTRLFPRLFSERFKGKIMGKMMKS